MLPSLQASPSAPNRPGLAAMSVHLIAQEDGNVSPWPSFASHAERASSMSKLNSEKDGIELERRVGHVARHERGTHQLQICPIQLDRRVIKMDDAGKSAIEFNGVQVLAARSLSLKTQLNSAA